MDAAGMSSFLKIGETIAVEFKRCGNGIENDVYETVCSFLNRFGGDLFLGLLDDGNPKNPIVSSFFRNIGYADQLGSGVRNLFKYSVYYSGKEPQFVEGDVFRIIVPLEKTFLGDSPTQSATAPPDSPTQLVITQL